MMKPYRRPLPTLRQLRRDEGAIHCVVQRLPPARIAQRISRPFHRSIQASEIASEVGLSKIFGLWGC